MERILLRALRTCAARRLPILVQGVGIGLASAVLAVVWPALFGDGDLPDGRRLVAFSTRWSPTYPMPVDDVRHIAEHSRTFDWTETFRTFNTSLTFEGRTRVEIGGYVSPTLFQRLDVRPVVGRLFAAEDVEADAPPVALLSHRLWHRAFGADERVLGSTLEVNRELATVVGILPPGVHFPLRHDVWMPMRDGRSWSGAPSFGLAQLAAGVDLESARLDIERLAGQLDVAAPEDEARQPAVDSYLRAHLGDRNLEVLQALLGGVILLLCLVTSNLSVLRRLDDLRRAPEVSTRRALGAGPLRLLLLAVREAALVACGGCLLACLLLVTTLPVLRTVFEGSSLDRLTWTYPDPVFGWLGCVLLSALLFLLSLAAAATRLLHTAWRPEVFSGASLGARGFARRSTPWWSRPLLATQIGLAMALAGCAIWGAGAAAEWLLREPGFDIDPLHRISLSSYHARLDGDAALTERLQRIEATRRALADLPEIAEVSVASAAPWVWARTVDVSLEPSASASRRFAVAAYRVDPNYASTAGLQLLAGQPLDGTLAAQARPGAEQVWVSRSLAERIVVGGDEVLGRRIHLRSEPTGTPTMARVAGVFANLDLPGDDDVLRLYRPLQQVGQAIELLVRTRGGALPTRERIDRLLAGYAPGTGIVEIESARRGLTGRTWARRRVAQVLTVFTACALLVTFSGVFAVLALAVQLRRREFALRSALGATRGQVAALVRGEALIQLLLALPIAWAVTRLASRWIGPLLDQRTAPVWATAVAVATVALIVLGAAGRPSRQATRVDLVTELRSE